MTDQIAFTEEYQTKILSLMMANNEFKFAIKDQLLPDNFGSSALQWFYDKLSDEDVLHTKLTLKEELMAAAKTNVIRKDEVDKYVSIYNGIKNAPLPVEEDHIKGTVSQFIRTQSVKRAILESMDLIQTGEGWDQIAEMMTTACATGLSVTDGGHRYLPQHYDRLLKRAQTELTSKLPTGVPELDSMLNGGIKQKQLGFVAGGTGRGKSLFLQWITRTSLLLGKKVVYFTLELSEEDMAARFDSMLAEVKFNEIDYRCDEIRDKMEELHAKFGDALVIKEYPADTATVNTLKSFLMRLSATGFVPDLVVVDYLDLLKPHRNYKNQHEELDSLTKALRGLASSMNLRIWTASQLNRAGIVMENPDETAVSGSIGKLFAADIAVFMAQTSDERMKNMMRLIVMKNRNGIAQKSVCITQDYSYMTFYKEGFDFGETATEEDTVFEDDDEDEARIG